MQKKRKPRKGIDLEKSNPLIEHRHKVFVRTKFCTPVFGGNPIPEFPKDDFDVLRASEEEKEKADQREHLSKGIIASFTHWTVENHGTIKTQFEFSNLRLLTLVKAWDNRKASEINKRRFRSI